METPSAKPLTLLEQAVAFGASGSDDFPTELRPVLQFICDALDYGFTPYQGKQQSWLCELMSSPMAQPAFISITLQEPVRILVTLPLRRLMCDTTTPFDWERILTEMHPIPPFPSSN